MKFLEKSLEDIIFHTPKKELYQRGLPIVGKRYKQLKITGYGVADVVSVLRKKDENNKPYLSITILELKQDKLSVSTLLQASRYALGIEAYLDTFRKVTFNYKINILIIGRTIDNKDNFMNLRYMMNFGVFTYEYKFDGIYFIPHLKEFLPIHNFLPTHKFRK